MDTNTSLTVGRDVEIGFLVNPRYPDSVTLMIGDAAEISFDLSSVETLRDKAGKAVHELREAASRRVHNGP